MEDFTIPSNDVENLTRLIRKCSYDSHAYLAIIFRPFMRAKSNCSTEAAFETESTQLFERFKRRGYGMWDLKRSYEKVKSIPRESLLGPRRSKVDAHEGIWIIGTHSNQSGQIFNIIRWYWDVLHDDKYLSKILPKNPIIGYKRGENLRDLLVAIYKETHHHMWPPPGYQNDPRDWSFQCGHCKACTYTHSKIICKPQEWRSNQDQILL